MTMRSTIAAIAIFIASTGSGFAETCHDKFVRLLIDGNEDGPVKIHAVQEIKGGMTSTNNFFQVSIGHWMTQMIEPANQPWTLAHNNVMYTSADEGKTWQKIRTMDSGQNKDASIKAQQENAETVKNAACGEEELDGVMHDTVEADFNILQNFKSENHYKYWVNRETGWISQATYDLKGQGFESFTTQVIESAPDLTLPTPE